MTLWLIISLLALVAVALAGSLLLFVVLKKEVWANARKREKQYEQLLAGYRDLETQVERIRAEFIDLQAHTGMLVAPTPPPSGLNISKRSQAIRMLRRGDSVDQVCAVLNLPGSEIALLAKIERLAAAATQSDPHGAASR
jgi:type II secretory pathway component PulM